jgi:hypothetical protein
MCRDNSDDGGESMELQMPFVNVRSRGGIFDDPSYAAGWEMGNLEAVLHLDEPTTLELTIHTANLVQADLIAMRHRYDVTKSEPIAGADEWAQFAVTKIKRA